MTAVNPQTGEVRPQPKKALSFWSHFGNHDAVRKEFPDASCMGSNFKYGLPAVELWTLHVEPEKEEEYRARFSPFVYDFKNDEPEVLVAIREILGEFIGATLNEGTIASVKEKLLNLISKEEKKIKRNLHH